MVRALAAAGFVLIAGGHVARTLWMEALLPSHPEVLSAVVMTEVGTGAASGEVPSENTLAKVQELARLDPLGWEPFLIQGAIALRAGDTMRAEHLIESARDRAPRSPAARYLLAEVYLRSGRPELAMTEMAVLHRLAPAASAQLAPALADYARTPGSLPQLRRVLASYPELEGPVLAQLSWDPRNADLIVALASKNRSIGPAPDWQRLMLTTLVNSGQYEKAYDIWLRFVRVPGVRGKLYDAGFRDHRAPAPFSWQLAKGAAGVAERSDGGLQVLYFGRDDAELASQVTLLHPGKYRLSMKLAGDITQSAGLKWVVTCLDSKTEIFELALAGPGIVTGEWIIPAADCRAQRIALVASSPELPRPVDFRLSDLRLSRIRS